MNTDEYKKACGYRVVDERIKSGMRVGLGTGSTACHAIRRLGELLSSGSLVDVSAVATSFGTQQLCQEFGIPVFSLNDSRIGGELDIAIDGADEVNPANQLIKGGGGAHLLEKIVEYSSREFYVIVDQTKLVHLLNKRFAIPVEIISEARQTLSRCLESQGYEVKLRMAKAKVGPLITDSGNQLLDIYVPQRQGLAPGSEYDPEKLVNWLNTLPGAVGNGLFTRPVNGVYIGTEDGVLLRS